MFLTESTNTAHADVDILSESVDFLVEYDSIKTETVAAEFALYQLEQSGTLTEADDEEKKSLTDKVKSGASKAWEAVKAFAIRVYEVVKGFLSRIVNILKDAFSKVKARFSGNEKLKIKLTNVADIVNVASRNTSAASVGEMLALPAPEDKEYVDGAAAAKFVKTLEQAASEGTAKLVEEEKKMKGLVQAVTSGAKNDKIDIGPIQADIAKCAKSIAQLKGGLVMIKGQIAKVAVVGEDG